MLKKCYGLFLGLVVLAGSACVTPTHASSASIVITNIRAGSSASALEEGVVLYNNSSFEVDISGWCLSNKTQVTFACIARNPAQKVIIHGYSYATIVSTIAQVNPMPNFYTHVYEPSNHSSGAIVASSDTISLLDLEEQVIDQYSWTTSLSSGQQWEREKFSVLPDFYLDTNSLNDWQKRTYTSFPVSQVEYREVIIEPEEPSDPEIPVEEPVATLLPAIITELLPNAVGSDTGNEYIEIFNPNLEGDISLAGYTLSIGTELEKTITLVEYILKPGEYIALANSEYSYTLLNTSSKVRLTTNEGIISSDITYTSPADGEAWAFIDEMWQYTNLPTPGAVNSESDLEVEEEQEDIEIASTVKPCATNQYRSVETNRCRLISSTTPSVPTPCKVDQVRNPETNRCRNITASTATPCKEGQERNLETNRCRNIKQLATADFGVKGATTKQQGGMGWYMWAAIGGVVLLVLGYAVWEWREELKKLISNIRAKFAGRQN